MGVSLENVTLRIRNNENGKIVFEELGEMLFTHFGISGPLVLSASCHMNGMKHGKYTALIDFKPALVEQTLDKRILSDFSKAQNKDFSNALGALLPSKIIPFMNSVKKEYEESSLYLIIESNFGSENILRSNELLKKIKK